MKYRLLFDYLSIQQDSVLSLEILFNFHLDIEVNWNFRFVLEIQQNSFLILKLLCHYQISLYALSKFSKGLFGFKIKSILNSFSLNSWENSECVMEPKILISSLKLVEVALNLKFKKKAFREELKEVGENWFLLKSNFFTN